MQKTATLNLRVDPEVKESAETVLSQLGLSMSTAIDLFLRQVSLTGGIPFKVALPEAPNTLNVAAITDEQLRNALLRGLGEVNQNAGLETAAAFSQIRARLDA
ncbi:MAG: type II toxin-antitoxin system RelB/DinJ family antitoxin [Coriobacteriales bacterium]|nr:type II toxin-antitoxin system RelB/DinJ family antitoxin [Coriobacteriales bacterium]